MKQSRKARAASLRNLRKARAARRRRSHPRRRRRSHRRNPAVAPVTVARQPNRMKRRRKRKHNPVAAVPATPAARQPNRARRRTRRKRRSNPVTLQANAVRRSRRTGKFVKGRNRRRSGRGRRRRDRRNARRVGARRRNTHYKSVGGYSRKRTVKRHRRRVNPVGVGGLVRNQFSRARLMEYGAGVLGLGLGLTVADLVDRYVATMPPEGGQNPWYGRNAAAAYQRRPDVMRLGAQGLGALVAMVATYVTRNVKGAPWLFGGIAGGFGINLVQQGMRWWMMPMLLKSDNPNEASWATRLYPLEQKVIQDPVAAMFENLTGQLAAAQSVAGGVAISPLAAAPPPGGVYALGKNNGQRRLIPTGKLGECASCGGSGGCYEDCADYNCEGCGNGDAMYEMEHGDNMDQMTAEAGVSPGVVYGLNGGKTFFAAGERVRVPHALGRYLQRRDAQRGLAGTPEAAAPAPVASAAPVVDMSDHFGGNGFNGTNDAAMDLMNGYNDAAAE